MIHKLQLGIGDTGIAVGYEKMRDAEGKMDGKLIGKVLGYFSYPDEREGKVFVFPHLFAEVMQAYMDEYGVTGADLAAIAVQEYANAKFNSCAQMNKVQITLEQALKIEGLNRYVVDGLPLKTYDCSQITDGYASLILATEEGLAKLGVAKSDCVQIAGWGQATDPIRKAGRDVLHPTGAYRAMDTAYEMAGASPADVNVAEVHDCFSVMGAIGTEVIGKGGARPRRAILGGRQGATGWRVRHQYLGRADREGPPHRRYGYRHDRLGRAAVTGQAPGGVAGEEPETGGHVQYRRPHLRQRLHGAAKRGVREQLTAETLRSGVSRRKTSSKRRVRQPQHPGPPLPLSQVLTFDLLLREPPLLSVSAVCFALASAL